MPLVFFSLAGSKLPGYILPCLPPLALLMGRAADRLVRRQPAPPFGGARAVAVIGLVLAGLVSALPAALYRWRDPAWVMAVPLAGMGDPVRVRLRAARGPPIPTGALAILRVGGAGFLLLLTQIAPGVVARRESGRDLFLPAHGREVLALGAWRTAWMAGYFYNDGRVREVSGLAEVAAAADGGPVLVLAGPSERRTIEATRLRPITLAEGPRETACCAWSALARAFMKPHDSPTGRLARPAQEGARGPSQAGGSFVARTRPQRMIRARPRRYGGRGPPTPVRSACVEAGSE